MKHIVLAFAVAGALVLAACGGGGGSSGDAAAAFTNTVAGIVGSTSETTEPVSIDGTGVATSETAEPAPFAFFG